MKTSGKPVLRIVLCWLVLFGCSSLPSLIGAPVTVGATGTEPLLAIAPDGTLYISALQHLYRSTDSGVNWTKLPGPIYASQLNLNSDSSMAVDPGGRLYFTFDYPYAGTTAVCTSDDKGDTWTCNPAVVPGGTDRMWVLAPTNDAAYEVTNEGLYETTFLSSNDRGLTWVPRALASGLLEPQSGPLFQKQCSSEVLQPIKTSAGVQIYVYAPSMPGAIISTIRSTGLGLPTALPSAALSLDGMLYVATEESNSAGGRHVIVARSPDEGKTWTKLPPIPATSTGTATFTWVAAGAPGHVGVIYYYTTDNGDPGALANSTWSVVWAESHDADQAAPTWTVTTIEAPIHVGAICIAAGCMGTDRFAGDFINAIIDSTGVAHLTWMKREGGTGAASIRYTSILSGPLGTFTPQPCGAATPTPTPTPSPSPAATPTPTPNPTPTPTPSPGVTPSPSPSITPTPSPSPNPDSTPSPTPSVTPTPSGTPSPSPTPSPSASATPSPIRLVNISGRVFAQGDDKTGIGGFIIQGPGLKRVMVRGIGPSLKVDGKPVPGALQNPVLELHDSSGGFIVNDDWRTVQEGDVEQTGIAPTDDRESSIVTSLRQGNYTAVIRGEGNTSGVALMEIYDLQPTNSAQLGNLAVRADVGTGDSVLIDGLIIRGETPKRVVLRAIGPTLQNSGISGALQNPFLALHDGNGTLLTENDNWKEASNAADIQTSGLAPTDDRESAILMILSSGNYTAIVSGANRTTGIALAEAYKLD